MNILPTSTMKKLGKTSHDLVPTDVVVSNFIVGITGNFTIRNIGREKECGIGM